jgi:cell division protein FtsQ
MNFPWKKALLTGLLGALTVVLFAGAALGVQHQSNRKIAGIHWMLEQPADQPLLAEQDLRQLAAKMGAPFSGKIRKEINIRLLEETLETHPLVEKAEVFSTWDGTLHVQIQQKIAKVRVIQIDKSFYLDTKGHAMPLSKRATAAVPVLTGDLDSARIQQGFRLLESAATHSTFPGGWTGLEVDRLGTFTAYPAFAPHALVWGRPLRFDDKAHRLSVFYTYMTQAGLLDSLSQVNVRFNGQVVYSLHE